MAGLGAGKIVEVGTATKSEVPSHEILWASAFGYGENASSCDLKRVPSLAAVKARLSAKPAEPLGAFVNAACMAQERIFVLDSYLFRAGDERELESRIARILQWLPLESNVKDVKLLTAGLNAVQRKTVEDAVQGRVEQINRRNQQRPYQLVADISWNLETNFDFVHDRFAIIDNELWHFGATIGGLHAKVSAATRGWKADEHDAVRFFNEAWAGDGGSGGRRRHG